MEEYNGMRSYGEKEQSPKPFKDYIDLFAPESIESARTSPSTHPNPKNLNLLLQDH